MSEINTIENEVKSEVAKIEGDVKIDFHKVMAILRALLPGDHEAISEVKKLAGENVIPESIVPSGNASIGGSEGGPN